MCAERGDGTYHRADALMRARTGGIGTPAPAIVVVTTAGGQQAAVNVQHIVRIDPVPPPPAAAQPAVPQGRRGDRYKALRPLPGT